MPPKKKKTKKNTKITSRKNIRRDTNTDKSIKININTGGGGGKSNEKSNLPPSVNVYPQQHLVHDRNDRTPLIDDSVGQSNLLQLLNDKYNNEQRQTRELMDRQFQQQNQSNQLMERQFQEQTKQQQQLLQGTNNLLQIAGKIPLREGNRVMIPPVESPKLIESVWQDVPSPIQEENPIKEETTIQEETPKKVRKPYTRSKKKNITIMT